MKESSVEPLSLVADMIARASAEQAIRGWRRVVGLNRNTIDRR
jgi:hypothetical protein